MTNLELLATKELELTTSGNSTWREHNMLAMINDTMRLRGEQAYRPLVAHRTIVYYDNLKTCDEWLRMVPCFFNCNRVAFIFLLVLGVGCNFLGYLPSLTLLYQHLTQLDDVDHPPHLQ